MVCGLALASCTPPLPPDAAAAVAEKTIVCVPGNQEVQVPEYLVNALTFVSSTLTGQCPEQSITFLADDKPRDVVFVDHPPFDQEIANFEKFCASPVLIAPVFGVTSVIGFNIIGLDGLVLTPQAVAGILDGSITAWNDPLIAEANDGYELDATPITFMHLDTPDGRTAAITGWLAKDAPESWSLGQVDVLETGQSFKTEQELLDAFNTTEGAVAILPNFAAAQNVIPTAVLPIQGVDINPVDTDLPKIGIAATEYEVTDEGYMIASHAVGGVPVEGQFNAAAARIVILPDTEELGWPAIAMTHVMACDDPARPLAKSTAQFMIRLVAQGVLETGGLTPLSEPVRVLTFPALKVEVPTDPEALLEDEAGAGS